MSRSLLTRIEALEQEIAPEPMTIFIRHFVDCGHGIPATEHLTLANGVTVHREAGESVDQFTKRAEKLAPVINGTRILHECC